MRVGIIAEGPIERIGLAWGMVPTLHPLPGGQGPGLQIGERVR